MVNFETILHIVLVLLLLNLNKQMSAGIAMPQKSYEDFLLFKYLSAIAANYQKASKLQGNYRKISTVYQNN